MTITPVYADRIEQMTQGVGASLVGPGWLEVRPDCDGVFAESHPSREDDPIVGHKTMADGSHMPLRQSEANALWQAAEDDRAKRLRDMPTEQDAINALFAAYQRLKELDWNDPVYCPKDGSSFDVIEAGSSGIHRAHYEGEWPTGSWWVEDGGDLWPSRPTLYRRTEAEKAKWAELGKRFRDSAGASAHRPNPTDTTHQGVKTDG